jgi:hypothetical protein
MLTGQHQSTGGDHLASFLSSREEISYSGIELPTSFLEIWVSLHHHPVVRVVSDQFIGCHLGDCKLLSVG